MLDIWKLKWRATNHQALLTLMMAQTDGLTYIYLTLTRKWSKTWISWSDSTRLNYNLPYLFKIQVLDPTPSRLSAHISAYFLTPNIGWKVVLFRIAKRVELFAEVWLGNITLNCIFGQLLFSCILRNFWKWTVKSISHFCPIKIIYHLTQKCSSVLR